MTLKIKNANIHNLKNFSISIPHNKFVCITGVSGSGKSSLITEIIEKEANKRFFESFSVYARTYLAKTGEAKADEISGIRPVISIRQKTITGDLRSTAGTLSGISDLLRLLMARYGKSSENKDTKKLSRGMFSFNNPLGQCSNCNGLGEEEYIDEKLLVDDESKTLRDRALKITLKDGYTVYSQVTIDVLDQVCMSEGFNVDIPLKDLNEQERNVLFHGSNKIKIAFGKHTLESRMKWSGIVAKPRDEGYYKGIIPIMSEILLRDRNKNILKFVSSKICSACKGSGLKKESLAVLFIGKNFPYFTSQTFNEIDSFFKQIDTKNDKILEEIVTAILKKCLILNNLGLGYLTPERKSVTLSGGESQRLRIASILDSKMSGIMYIFDEPSIGLHGTDNFKLINIFKELVNRGNSVIVVEHDKETILASDYIIDIGPKAGYLGGKLLYSGNTSEFKNVKNSVTCRELNKKISFKTVIARRNNEAIPSSQPRQSEYTKVQKSFISNNLNSLDIEKIGIASSQVPRNDSDKILFFKNIKYNNLKNINASFKLNSLNVVTGVSGSGKTSLVNGVIGKYFRDGKKDFFKEVSSQTFNTIVEIDAKQPGKNSRSNAATYTGIFENIRKLFSKLPNSLPSSSFSFNTGKGRCEECLGKGETEITMHFLDNIKIECNSCNGKRFHDDVLKIEYNGKNVYEVLEMEISDVKEFFKKETKIFNKLNILEKLGLGYLKLGQSTSTLSGGEAKRLKLSAYLDTKAKNNLILLDEPTTGLSMYDTKVLLKSLENISKNGNTIIAIEHDAYFISQSDYILDLGVGAGDLGGEVLYNGEFGGLLDCERSLTARIFGTENNDESKILRQAQDDRLNNIILEKVKTNNLQNISLNIEKNKITLIKGSEGAGKTSLAVETIFNEANNLYLSSLSAYARQFIGTGKKGNFKEIKKLTPAISLATEKNRADKIIFAQVSGIYDLYRLLYSRFSTTNFSTLPENHKKNSSLFSFLHVTGACPACSGKGIFEDIDVKKLADFNLSIEDGALNSSKPGKFFTELKGQYIATLYTVMEKLNIEKGSILKDYSKYEQDIIFNGTGDKKEYDVKWSFKRANRTGVMDFKTTWKGFLNLVKEDYLKNLHNTKKKNFDGLLSENSCKTCNGKRLNDVALSYKIGNLSINDLIGKSIKDQIEFLNNITGETTATVIARRNYDAIPSAQPRQSKYNKENKSFNSKNNNSINVENIGIASSQAPRNDRIKNSKSLINKIIKKLKRLEKFNLSYLSLDRSYNSLSSGEKQRLRLAMLADEKLRDILYILDEPANGLYYKEESLIFEALKELKEQGNTVIITDSKERFVYAVDNIIELENGDIKYNGNAKKYTSTYKLSSDIIPFTKCDKFFTVKNASLYNLKNIDVKFSYNTLNIVHGPCGSGKSTLVFRVLAESLMNGLNGCSKIELENDFSNIIVADDHYSSITIGSFFDLDKLVYDKLAKENKVKKTIFTSTKNYCQTCNGRGSLKGNLDFLRETDKLCSVCNGKKYKPEILEYKLSGCDIFELFSLSLEKLVKVVENKTLLKILTLFNDFAMSKKISLNRKFNTLSIWERKRLVMIKKMFHNSRNNLILIDEPSAGLNLKDLDSLLIAFQKLIKDDNTIVITEHDRNLISYAGRSIELCFGSGEDGGYLVKKKFN